MKFGIKTAQQHCTWQQMADIWQAADQLEVFDSAWNFDHFYPLVGDPEGPCMEGWVTLSALAAMTRRLRIGCMVNGVLYRHPGLLAKMAATLDIVSNGRLELGLGAGWHEAECAAYGIDLLPMRQRMDRFDEAVSVIVALLTEESVDFDGTYYQLAGARCEPKAVQRPRPPIVIGGRGERRTLRTVARHADHWNLPSGDPAEFTAKRAVLERHCESLGRDSAEIECSAQVPLPPEQAPGETAAQAAALRDAGADTVVFTLRPPYDVRVVEPLARALEPLR